MRGPSSFALYASDVSIAITWPNCSPIVRRNASSLRSWQRSTICTHTGQSSLAIACGALESKCGRQLAKKIAAASHFRSAYLRLRNLPSSLSDVTSNELFAFSDSKVRDGCNVSLAQAVRVFSPGCLPCIRPSNETAAFAAQLALRVMRSSSGIATLNFRSLSVWLGRWSCSFVVGWHVCCSWSLYGGCSVMVVWALVDLEVCIAGE